jgi:hypothetical protein
MGQIVNIPPPARRLIWRYYLVALSLFNMTVTKGNVHPASVTRTQNVFRRSYAGVLRTYPRKPGRITLVMRFVVRNCDHVRRHSDLSVLRFN